MAVFTNYEGDDFCSGLIFGSNGAQMLVNIAKTLINFKNIASGGGANSVMSSLTGKKDIKQLLPESSSSKSTRPSFRKNGEV